MEKYCYWLVRVVADLIPPTRHSSLIDKSFNQAYLIAAKTAMDARLEGTKRTKLLASKIKMETKIFDVDATNISNFG